MMSRLLEITLVLLMVAQLCWGRASLQGNLNQPNNMPPPALLPASMANINLPHKFTPEEMDRIVERLRAFALELEVFSVVSQSMGADQLQQNYQYAIWPIMQCLIANP